MGLLTTSVSREIGRIEYMIRKYEEIRSSLPKGTICEKHIGNKDYYYLKYRDGDRIVSDYIHKEDLVNLTELVEHTIKELGADPERIYFIGNGGGAIYQSLSLGAHIYAAAAMLTTIFNFFDDGSEMKYLDNLAAMPVYITHATSDFACPVGRSRLSHTRLRELGNKNLFYLERSDQELARFGIDTENEVGTHNSALLDYAGDEMFRWLFSFRKERN